MKTNRTGMQKLMKTQSDQKIRSCSTIAKRKQSKKYVIHTKSSQEYDFMYYYCIIIGSNRFKRPLLNQAITGNRSKSVPHFFTIEWLETL